MQDNVKNTISAIRVFIADDQPLVRSALRSIVDAEPDLFVVGEAADGPTAARLAARTSADVVLMDVEMPGGDGISGVRDTLAACPDAQVLILTMFDLDDYVFHALREGASGFLLKTVPPGELVAAIRDVHHGRRALSPPVLERLVANYLAVPAPESAPAGPFSVLTDRELEVVIAIAHGRSNAEISDELQLSLATVKTYVTRILTKLGLRDRVQLAILAYESGVIRPGQRTIDHGASEVSTFGD